MRFTNQRLALWYGTADAPAPAEGGVQERRGVALTVAVQPVNPSNTVTVRYRVDDGLPCVARAVRRRTDLAADVEYHQVVFPDFRTGERVEYLPMLTCAGRSVPDSETARTHLSSFRLAPAPLSCVPPAAVTRAAGAAGWTPPADRLPYAMEYLATIHVPLKEPETIGVTPEGIKVNWYWSPAEGIVIGPTLKAKVRNIGGDWMTIRRDGVGLMDVRATLETTEGALLWVDYQGYYELGPNGYQDFLDRRWPMRAPTRTAPRFHTAHPNYLWLNRVQCIGIGEVTIGSDVAYTYDLYALR